jgi:hypothetical protein
LQEENFNSNREGLKQGDKVASIDKKVWIHRKWNGKIEIR